jgi:hypothetical protein
MKGFFVRKRAPTFSTSSTSKPMCSSRAEGLRLCNLPARKYNSNQQKKCLHTPHTLSSIGMHISGVPGDVLNIKKGRGRFSLSR